MKKKKDEEGEDDFVDDADADEKEDQDEMMEEKKSELGGVQVAVVEMAVVVVSSWSLCYESRTQEEVGQEKL